MTGDTTALLSGAAVAILILREVIPALRPQKTNGHERAHAELLSELALIREDTRACRTYMHTIINQLQSVNQATDLMIRRLEK